MTPNIQSSHPLMTFLPAYYFTSEQDMRFLKKILHLMMTHAISPNPVNYTIWYEYVVGNNKRLIAAVDALIKEKNTFDAETGLELYKRHVCDGSLESFEKINQDLQRLIHETKQSVESTSQQASKAGDSFEEKAVSIESSSNLPEIKNIITEVVSETKNLAALSQSLKMELDEANEEMDRLRHELDLVKQTATLDALTGLFNRGSFDQTLIKIMEQSPRKNTCLSLLDLDHFKRINDNFGHLIGDEVLKYTASILKKLTEKGHFVARYGGEELAIIMPDTSLKKAMEISEKIRTALEQSKLKRKNNSESIGKITISIGIAALKPEDTVESFIMRADDALYKAKESGRNKVVIESRC
ncbi:MAG: GGDEF domain-containing protein [Gammaproteobacteria bacterium]